MRQAGRMTIGKTHPRLNEFLRHNEAGINSSRPEVPKTKIWVLRFHSIRDSGRAVFKWL